MGKNIWIDDKLIFDGAGQRALGNIEREPSGTGKNGTGLQEALMAVGVDAEFSFDGVTFVPRGAVKSGYTLHCIFCGKCSAEGKRALRIVACGDIDLRGARRKSF